jgi:endonuclease/exonuclease/phosphatase family metal-dependent hydrolase
MIGDMQFKALTINIWNRQGPWPRRRLLLRQGIERMAPDVVGLQEVLNGPEDSQLQQLAAGLGYEQVFGEAIARADGTSYGNAILTRHPIARHEVFALPGSVPDEPRCVLLVEIELGHGRLPVLVTHLAWRGEHGYVREEQVAAIADIVDRVPRGSGVLPPILMGDLNASPEATEIRFLTGLHALNGRSICLSDCYAEVGRPPGFTFDGIHNAFAAPWHERPRRIDYVFVRGPDLANEARGKPLAAEVVFTETVDGITASDHYGVLATIAL